MTPVFSIAVTVPLAANLDKGMNLASFSGTGGGLSSLGDNGDAT